MKIYLVIMNAVSAIFLISMAFSNPSITGLSINLVEPKLVLASPLGFATLFIFTTIALDVYFYLKSRSTS
ncbi:hypothetical protein KY358_07160 [Candidatus Woesearchaeota archaeon]|nr:hypothetical protein [Candidatus Woesearchaeota archaeon]